jgi:peptidoglycan/LPS O-acetylase OafA/YrhL
MKKRRLPYLDGLRGLAALYVVLHHIFLQSWPTDDLQAVLHAQLLLRPLFILNYGHYAVTVFIAISGFSLMLPVASKGAPSLAQTGNFFYRRARRILPPYYAAVVLATLLALTIHHGDLTRYNASLPITKSDIVTHFLLVHNLSPEHYSKIAGPFWSIAVESQIYLFFPLVLLIRAKWGRVWTFVSFIALTSVSFYLSGVSHGILSHSSPPGIYFVVFGLGMYFADCAVNGMKFRFGPISLATGILTLIILCGGLEKGQVGKITDVLIGTSVSALMAYCLVTPQAGVAGILSHPLLAGLGTFSYSLYLIHFPLVQVFWEQLVFPLHASRAVSFFIVAVAGLALTLLASYLFYWMFERPFLSATGRQPQPNHAGAAPEMAAVSGELKL